MSIDAALKKGRMGPVLFMCLFLLGLSVFSAGIGVEETYRGHLFKIGPAENNEPAARIALRVNPAVELFSTIHRLAGTGQYDEMLLPEYDRRVDDYFGKYRDHKAVKLAVTMRDSHYINGNAPMSLACYLGAPPELKPRAPFNPPPGTPDPRWTQEAIDMFLPSAREFARDTEFMAFFKSQKDFYDLALANIRATMAETDLIPWFEGYFGYLPDNYVIILGMQNGSCNYGQSVIFPDGSREFVSILGARWPDQNGAPQYPEDWFVGVVIHEFCHSYINPLVNKHRGILREAGEAIFPHVAKAMKESGYNFWYVMIQEYLVRACTTRCVAASAGDNAAARLMMRDLRGGFSGIEKLNALMKEYEAGRDKYPDMEAFMPRVAEFFEEFANTFK